jgi:hypothetical protein
VAFSFSSAAASCAHLSLRLAYGAQDRGLPRVAVSAEALDRMNHGNLVTGFPYRHFDVERKLRAPRKKNSEI